MTAEPNVFVQATRIRHRRFPKTFWKPSVSCRPSKTCVSPKLRDISRGHVLHHPTLPLLQPRVVCATCSVSELHFEGSPTIKCAHWFITILL